jgi:hypothetical protein
MPNFWLAVMLAGLLSAAVMLSALVSVVFVAPPYALLRDDKGWDQLPPVMSGLARLPLPGAVLTLRTATLADLLAIEVDLGVVARRFRQRFGFDRVDPLWSDEHVIDVESFSDYVVQDSVSIFAQ